MSTVAAALIGAASWTATEYGMHRFLMHEKRGPALAAQEHLQHHADVTYFTPASKKLLSAAVTTAFTFPIARVLTSQRTATAFTAGTITAYFGYEVAHRRIHTHAPTTAWGRWQRRNHLAHHFGSPMANHGVTTPVWDRVFGTAKDPGVVTVPRRMAPTWMLDDDGEVRPAYAAHYRVRGRRVATADDVARDHADAFANRVPLADPEAVGAPAEGGVTAA